MAVRTGALSVWAGAASAALVLALTLGTLGAVAWRADGFGALGPRDWGYVWFTVWQAAASAAISVALAIPVARALARRQFRGRSALITVLGAPFILPTIVAILGLLAVFGRTGIVSDILSWAGLEPVSIYGIHGILLAHVFFNLPFATRLILQGWLSIPAERFRLAASLGFSATDVARVLERPMLRDVVPGVFLVIFLICTTSFAVALALGGGPQATTVELAIYQAFRFDFNLSKAALLGLVQVMICVVAGALVFKVRLPSTSGVGLDRVVRRWEADGLVLRLQDALCIGLAALFLLGPLSMIVIEGIGGVFRLPGSILEAAWNSIWVTAVSTILCMVFALSMALAVSRLSSGAGALVEGIGFLTIAASPLVMGTGLFVMIFPFADPTSLSLPITAVVNAAMALPFALRALVPAVRDLQAGYGKLSVSLGLSGFAWLRWVAVPRLRRALGFGAGLAAALSMGDLGVIALFSNPELETLPLALFRLMGAYRLDQAASAALLLVTLSLLAFWICDRGGRVNVDV